MTVAGRDQIDEVMSGSSYYSQNDLGLHFGLGTAENADRVDVLWPSGLKESFANVKADQIVVIQETKGIVKTEAFRHAR